MLENSARVTRVEAGVAWVRPESPSSCGACGGKGCGSSLLVSMLHPREPEYPVRNPIGAAPGEAVVVGIEEGALLSAAVAGYLVPLLLLLLGAMVGATLSEWASVAGGVAGLLLAAIWLKRRRSLPAPVILRVGQTGCSAS